MDVATVTAPWYDALMTVSGWVGARRRLVAGLSGAVLDVGCGTAAVALDLDLGAKYTGVDLSLAMLSRAQSGNVLCADCVALPFPDDSFDHVVSSAVLGLIPLSRRRMALHEMARVSRGDLRILEPVAPLGPVRRTIALSRHPLRLDEMTEAGWCVEAVGPRLYAGVYTLVWAVPAGQSR